MALKTVAIIQARMGSTRLPGKVLKEIAGTPVIDWVYERVSAAKNVDKVVIATSTSYKERPLIAHCKKHGYLFSTGSEENVLSRVYDTAHGYNASLIVDITGDCPLVDPGHIEKLVTAAQKMHHADKRPIDKQGVYVCNILPRSWPDGLDIQVYTRHALRRLTLDRNFKINREHTGWNFIQNLEPFLHKAFPAPKKYMHPEWGLTLDTIEDFNLLHKLCGRMLYLYGTRQFKVEKVLDYLLTNKHLLRINKKIKRKVPKVGK